MISLSNFLFVCCFFFFCCEYSILFFLFNLYNKNKNKKKTTSWIQKNQTQHKKKIKNKKINFK